MLFPEPQGLVSEPVPAVTGCQVCAGSSASPLTDLRPVWSSLTLSSKRPSGFRLIYEASLVKLEVMV